MTNYLDTRDLYRRQCELQEALDTLETELQDAQETLDDEREAQAEDEEGCDAVALEEAETAFEDARKALAVWKEEYQEELDELNDLETEVGQEWIHGTTLIPEDAFTAYAQELAEETGAIPADAGWPIAGNIDWNQAADELKMDYSACTCQGTDYLFRS